MRFSLDDGNNNDWHRKSNALNKRKKNINHSYFQNSEYFYPELISKAPISVSDINSWK